MASLYVKDFDVLYGLADSPPVGHSIELNLPVDLKPGMFLVGTGRVLNVECCTDKSAKQVRGYDIPFVIDNKACCGNWSINTW